MANERITICAFRYFHKCFLRSRKHLKYVFLNNDFHSYIFKGSKYQYEYNGYLLNDVKIHIAYYMNICETSVNVTKTSKYQLRKMIVHISFCISNTKFYEINNVITINKSNFSKMVNNTNTESNTS